MFFSFYSNTLDEGRSVA